MDLPAPSLDVSPDPDFAQKPVYLSSSADPRADGHTSPKLTPAELKEFLEACFMRDELGILRRRRGAPLPPFLQERLFAKSAEYRANAPRCKAVVNLGGGVTRPCTAYVREHGDVCVRHSGAQDHLLPALARHSERFRRSPQAIAKAQMIELKNIWRRASPMPCATTGRSVGWMWHPGSQRDLFLPVAIKGAGAQPDPSNLSALLREIGYTPADLAPAIWDWVRWQAVALIVSRKPTKMTRNHFNHGVGVQVFKDLMRFDLPRRIELAGPRPTQFEALLLEAVQQEFCRVKEIRRKQRIACYFIRNLFHEGGALAKVEHHLLKDLGPEITESLMIPAEYPHDDL